MVRLIIPLAAALSAVHPGLASPGAPAPAQLEVRALWVGRSSLVSPSAVTAMVQSARANGFNTLLVQVRGRGDAYFRRGIEPRASALSAQPESFDPLDLTLRLARQQGLRVHAWINVALVSSAVDLPTSRNHVARRHPEWLMIPRALARDLAVIAPGSRLYLDKLARWVRAQPEATEGLYLSPITEAAIGYTTEIVADIAARYPVDGVHLDYLRYPNPEFDFSADALRGFALYLDGMVPEGRPRARTVSALLSDVDAFPEEWLAFRRARLTALVTRLRQAVRAARPGAVISTAVVPDPIEAAERRLQDWRDWVNRGLVDVVCPMAYATDTGTFAAQVTSARAGAGTTTLWAGIGAYRLSSAQTVENIRLARRLGADGVVLFSYDSVAGPPGGAQYLSFVGREAFNQ